MHSAITEPTLNYGTCWGCANRTSLQLSHITQSPIINIMLGKLWDCPDKTLLGKKHVYNQTIICNSFSKNIHILQIQNSDIQPRKCNVYYQ